MNDLKVDYLTYLNEYKDRTIDDNLKYLFEIYSKYKYEKDITLNDIIYDLFKFMNIKVKKENLDLINQLDKEVIITSLYNLKYFEHTAVKGPITNYISVLEEENLDIETKLGLLKKYINLLEILNIKKKTDLGKNK